jgi:hypothetical protein
MNTKIRGKTQKVNEKISDKTKHIMKISHINLNINDKTATSQKKKKINKIHVFKIIKKNEKK